MTRQTRQNCRSQSCLVATWLTILLTMCATQLARSRAIDVSRLLSSKTRYTKRLPIPDAPSIYDFPDPPGYTAKAMWLLSRHGTRWPTWGRMNQINSLENVFKHAHNTAEYPWMSSWISPVAKVMHAHGELHPEGEDELWGLARRLKTRFPTILRSRYLPSRYPIVSTQVSRAAASASAFAAGYFPPVPSHELDESLNLSGAVNDQQLRKLREAVSSLKHGMHSRDAAGYQDLLGGLSGSRVRPQAVAMLMVPKNKDPLLRFFDMCPAYAQREEYVEKWLTPWLKSQWSTIAPALSERMGMKDVVGPKVVEAVWTLCQYEAGVGDITDGACSLFSDEDIHFMEWLDDVELLESLSWGSPLNYRMAAPLLQDMRATLQIAANCSSHHRPTGSEEPGGLISGNVHARLLFAHCETILPLATLMGLFKPELPPTPPQVQVPDQGVLDAVASAEEAMQHLQAMESTTDISHSNGSSSSDSNMIGDKKHDELPVPPGWYPITPFNDTRIFRGGRVAPFGANMAVILYASDNKYEKVRHKVRLLYNEQVIALPGCQPAGSPGGSDMGTHLDCDLDDFLAATQEAAGDSDALKNICYTTTWR